MDWIPCSERLPEFCVDVILYFHDTYHKHPSWPKYDVKPAWRHYGAECNSDGGWVIEGRLGGYGIELEDGIAWMPLPEPPAPPLKSDQENPE